MTGVQTCALPISARSLGLLNRLQDDMKAVIELSERLRELNPEDPVSYDFALYGLGVFEKGAAIPENLKELF